MKNILTIFRRDFTAYFTSPIGYIFMIVFLLISVGLYMTTFFAFPVADMRGFFSNLPVLLCVFIPAVTMRVWAEERKENTWEMLLTFPMRARELVLGKFLATLAFFALALAATCTVPIMLASLGNPDNGALFTGYLGTLFLGAFFLAIGIFFSALCKDQIVAFVVTLLACFAIFLVGTDFVAAQMDSWFDGLGTLLRDAVGLSEHYEAFLRGVIELTDILYFLVWIVLMLILNMMFIEGRSRAGMRVTFSAAVAICVGIGLAFNWLIAGQSIARADVTEDKIYTVSPATGRILTNLEAPVRLTLYITPKSEMPTALTSLEQDVLDKLEEMRLAGDGKLKYNVVNLRAANVLGKADDPFAEKDDNEPEDEAKAIEERMLDKGLAPFQVQAMDADQVTNKLIYSSIGVAYRAEKEEFIPQILPQNLDQLEYRLVNVIYKIARPEPAVVALVAPKDTVPPEMRQMYMQMGQPVPESMDPYADLEEWLRAEKYDVKRVALTKEDPLPDEYDTLVVLNPREFNERQWWEVNRALVSGKDVFLAVQEYEWNYQIVRNRLSVSKNPLMPNVNTMLEKYGLGVSKDFLMDVNKVTLNIPAGGDALARLLGGGQPVDLPIQMHTTLAQMNQDVSITSGLGMVLYLWGTALDLDDEKLSELGLEHQVLMQSSERAWAVPADAPTETLNDALQNPPAEGDQFPLMAMVTGQFPDAFKDEPRPAWPPERPRPGQPPQPPEEEGEPAPIQPAPGKLVLLGCAESFNDNMLTSANNLDLFLNTVDALALTEDLVHVRSKKAISRIIERPETGTRVFWKVVNYGAVNILLAAIGIGVYLFRRQRRIAYAAAYNN